MPRSDKRPRTMQVPSPFADVGEDIRVMNYRRGDIVEDGEVISAKFSLYGRRAGKHARGSWQYQVRLNRKSTRGNVLYLTVSDDALLPPRPRRS